MAVVQTQWSLDNTIFRSASVLARLIRAVADDDVQAPALLAFEALGSSMIVSAERINDGMDALEVKGRYDRVESLAVSLGLLPGGVAHFIRKDAQRCIPAFLLVASLKGTMADPEIGDMLWEMLVQQGLETKPELRCSRRRIQGVVTSISGFCDSIIPREVYDNVLRILIAQNFGESEMKKALMKPSSQVLANIFSRLFSSLSKADIDKITIGGLGGCAAVAASLLWLKEGEIELTVGGGLIQLTKGSKISLDLSTQYADGWEIREWSRQEILSDIIIPNSSMDLRENSLSLPGFIPASSAKHFIRSLYRFNEEQIKVVGAVATALSQLVLERWKFKGTRDNIYLKDLCQSSYLAGLETCMVCYGWTGEDIRTASTIVENMDDGFAQAVSNCPKNKLNSLTPRAFMAAALQHSLLQTGYHMTTDVGQSIAEAACHLAMESTYSSICSRFPETRLFRIGQSDALRSSANFVVTILHGMPSLVVSSNTIHYADLERSSYYLASAESLRHRCIQSLLPGVTEGFISEQDLVIGVNGYVANVRPFRLPTTRARDCMAIEIQAGYLRWDREPSPIRKLSASQIRPNDAQEEPSRCVDAYDRDEFQSSISLDLATDRDGLVMEHHLSLADQDLLLSSHLCNYRRGTKTSTDWAKAIGTVSTALHLVNQNMPGFAEEALTKQWRDDGVLSSLYWFNANEKHTSGRMRCVSRTYGNEELRFFLAGRALHEGFSYLIMRHGTTPIMKCIQPILDHGNRMGGLVARYKVFSRGMITSGFEDGVSIR